MASSFHSKSLENSVQTSGVKCIERLVFLTKINAFPFQDGDLCIIV